MKVCRHLEECEFFTKYSDQLNATCEILIANYCKGKKKNLCKRLLYFIETNKLPDADVAPNGMDLKKDQ